MGDGVGDVETSGEGVEACSGVVLTEGGDEAEGVAWATWGKAEGCEQLLRKKREAKNKRCRAGIFSETPGR
jgi:hypothetical protein